MNGVLKPTAPSPAVPGPGCGCCPSPSTSHDSWSRGRGSASALDSALPLDQPPAPWLHSGYPCVPTLPTAPPRRVATVPIPCAPAARRCWPTSHSRLPLTWPSDFLNLVPVCYSSTFTQSTPIPSLPFGVQPPAGPGPPSGCTRAPCAACPRSGHWQVCSIRTRPICGGSHHTPSAAKPAADRNFGKKESRHVFLHSGPPPPGNGAPTAFMPKSRLLF